MPRGVWECDTVKKDEPLLKAYELAVLALEKQIPKKPHKYLDFNLIERDGCPNCYEQFNRNEILYAGQKYCSVCGQFNY